MVDKVILESPVWCWIPMGKKKTPEFKSLGEVLEECQEEEHGAEM